MQDWQQPRSNSPRPPAWASWSDQQRGEGLFGDEAGQGEQFVDAEGDEGSSRASSPSKSPLLQSTRYLDQTDQPLVRHPRVARLSHQSVGGGSEAGDQLQQPVRPSMWPGQQEQEQHQPSSPPMSAAQYNSWYQQQGPDSRAADRAAAVGGSGGNRGERGGRPPNGRTLFAQQAEQQQQQQPRQHQQYQQPQQSETSRSDGGSGRQPFQQVPPQQPLYGGAAASDPMTYPAFDRDGVPNMGDVTHDNGAGGGWQIPAMRPANTPPSMQHTRHSPAPSLSGRRGGPGGDKKTPGAVVKLGRRQAWLKFLAYEGCWQICLDSFLQPSSSGEARQFLEDGCNLLRTALGLDSLLLTSVLRNPAANLAGGSAETAIYWDDKEEGALTAVEIETKMVQQPQQPALPPPQQPPKPPPMQPVLQPAPLPPRAPAAMPLLSGGSSSSANGRGPFLEASVVRVVGCDALNPANTKQYYLVLYPSGKSATDGGAWTLVSTDGSTHGHEAIELDPNLRQDTLAVELLEEDVALAMGTIQIAELHKLANQQDVFADDSPPPGFFKSLFPCWRTKGSTHSRMAWIKLVDNNGRTCGHAVLSARMVSATVGEMGFLGPRPVKDAPIFEEVGTLTSDQQYPQLKQRYQQAQQQAQYPSIHPQQTQQQQQPPAPPPYQQQQQGAGMVVRQPQPVQLPARREVTTCVVRVDPNSAAKQKNSGGGYLHVTALQVYDELLAAALKAEDCGTRKLELFGPWKWLLQEFAAVYGVRHFYTSLSYLKWVVRPENASVTALCFNVLLRELVPLKQAQVDKQLSSGELGVLAQVSQRIEELLTQCFENYFMLSEDAPNGMMEGALSIRGHIPPVLQPAVSLFGLLRDGMSAADQEWLAERFRVAAKKRFQGLLTATALQNPGSGGDRRGMANNGQDSPAAIQAYSSVEELSKAIMNELRADEGIWMAKVLPAFINLPDLTSVEYVQGIIRHLGHVLKRHPPPAPTEPAVLLVEAVGQLQAFVCRHEYRQANALLNSREIFGKFVHEWINHSYALLTQRCRALEAAAPAMAGWQDFDVEGKHRVAPLVEEMLSAIEGEMGRYERIITYWPMYGPDLEKCVTGALRESTISVSRQCGLVNTKEGTLPPNGQGQMVVARHGASPATRGGRTGWAWVTPHFDRMVMPATFHGMPVCLQQGINPNQALLLNSLRRLLAVSPQLEHRLVRWCGGADAIIQSQTNFQAAVGAERIARDAPNLGAQFAQMVKELRSEYFAAITLCAEKLSSTLAGQPATSVILILRHHGLKAQSAQTQGALTRIMEELEKLLLWLNSTLDNRVFVALTRGLWDLASKDVLQYAEDLNEAAEHNSWRGRQNASVAVKVLDQFFKGALTASMGNDLQNKDLALPAHSDRAHKLLAENLTSVAMSYDVF